MTGYKTSRRAHPRLRAFLVVITLAITTVGLGLTMAPGSAADMTPVTTYIASSDPVQLKALLAQWNADHGGTVTYKALEASDAMLATMPRDEMNDLNHRYAPFNVEADYPVASCPTASPYSAFGGADDARWNSLNRGVYSPNTDGYSALNQAAFMGANMFTSKGFTGQGIDVALIDTGVAPVGDLANPNVVIHGPDFSVASQAPNLTHNDQVGHGTHLAGIIHTVAPGARIVSLKVGSITGSVDVTQVVAAVDWAREHRNFPGMNIKVINLAYGSLSTNAWTSDELSMAIQKAWDDGITVVVSAGNVDPAIDDASNPGVLSPASNQNVLAVGAFDTHGVFGQQWSAATLAPFSSSSTRQDPRLPDVGAPGTSVISYRAPGAGADGVVAMDMCSPFQTYDDGTIVFDSNLKPIPNVWPMYHGASVNGAPPVTYIKGSGTSQAAAMASGAVALMLSKFNQTIIANGQSSKYYLSPDGVKRMLKGNAHSIPGGKRSVYGDGAIDLMSVYSATPPWSFTQTHDAVYGGTIEGSRGGMHILDPAMPNQSPSYAGTGAKCAPPDGGQNTATLYGEVSAVDSSVSLCGEQDIFGNKYNFLTHYNGVLFDSTYQLHPSGCSLTTKVGAYLYRGGVPKCDSEAWVADGQPITALPALDATGDLTSYNGGAVRGFVPDATLGFVWPSIDWSKNLVGTWGMSFPTGTATNWAHIPWAQAVYSPLTWNSSTASWSGSFASSTGGRDESWDGGTWDDPFQRSTWRASSWRLGSWRLGSWRLGSWRLGSWRLGSWREFGWK